MITHSTVLVGMLMALGGGLCVAIGSRCIRKFRAETNYSGIGGFRFSISGAAWLAGYLLVILGVSLACVSVMLFFL